ncbi:MAG: hypothetical protein KI790_14455 [Cyclobacteriaceae bacterium]|nr:hypothetical protein [Cyclobacteriaceae bacterium HetDA_MAG_MS6]
MKPYIFALAVLVVPLLSRAYSNPRDSINDVIYEFDELSYRWDQIAEALEVYEGLGAYCINAQFRTEVEQVLDQVHYFDRKLYDQLVELDRMGASNHELKTTIHQIREFETEYDLPSFRKYLRQECGERKELEREKKRIQNEMGEEGYDGQVSVVEIMTYKYVHHVTKLIDHIRSHIHHLQRKAKL